MFCAQSALDGIWIPFSDLNEADQFISVVHHGTMVHLLMQIPRIFLRRVSGMSIQKCVLQNIYDVPLVVQLTVHPNCTTNKFVL